MRKTVRFTITSTDSIGGAAVGDVASSDFENPPQTVALVDEIGCFLIEPFDALVGVSGFAILCDDQWIIVSMAMPVKAEPVC